MWQDQEPAYQWQIEQEDQDQVQDQLIQDQGLQLLRSRRRTGAGEVKSADIQQGDGRQPERFLRGSSRLYY